MAYQDSNLALLISVSGLQLTLFGLYLSLSSLSQYIVLLFIIVILEIVAGIVGFVFRTELVDLAESRALDAIDQYRPEGNPELQDDVNQIVDFLQNEVCHPVV